MTDVLSKIPLLGWGPIITIAAIAVSCLIIAILLWRNHKVWRWVFVFLFLVFGVGTVATSSTRSFAYYDNAADLLGIPTYPTVDGNVSGPDVQQQPNGAVTQITVPDTASHFGSFDAQVWLPPQYFSDSAAALPGRLSPAREPRPTDRLADLRPAARRPSSAWPRPVSRSSSSCPRTSRTTSPATASASTAQSQGNAETYLTKDVIAAIDTKFRTITNAKGRAIGGLSMGGYCALNLGLKHPDLYSVVTRLVRRDGVRARHPARGQPGALRRLGLAGRRPTRTARRSTSARWTAARARRSTSACGTERPGDPRRTMQAIRPKLQARGFTVEFHTLPGAHEYTYWTAGAQGRAALGGRRS